MDTPQHLPVPPGLVEEVARASCAAMHEAVAIGTPWESLHERVREAWEASARASIAVTLNRMIHEGWLVVRPPSTFPPRKD